MSSKALTTVSTIIRGIYATQPGIDHPFLAGPAFEAAINQLRDEPCLQIDWENRTFRHNLVGFSKHTKDIGSEVSQKELSRFLEEETIPGDMVQASPLYDAYLDWATRNDISPFSRNQFGRAMQLRGKPSVYSSHYKKFFYLGFNLKSK